MITADQLRDLVDYDPATGKFRWKTRDVAARRATVGWMNGRGYLRVEIENCRYLLHRLAWLYVHGEWPSLRIDHINRIKTDNRIENLRLATQTQNLWNMRVRSDNKSGFKGVHWNKARGKWMAYANSHGVRTNLGLFNDLSDAVAAYDAYALSHRGEFASNSNGAVGSA